ncbi:MAG: hypothetical protein DRJ15_02515 [Bacteroidetes bacterium]|nr:MAG: hypothetical protein DRJ15_02515 [Bacteroidota bacterium]
MWCTIINGGLLILWVLCQMAMPRLLYKTQTAFFPMEKEKFNQVFYLFLGIYKIFFVMFNAVPYIVLMIMG